MDDTSGETPPAGGASRAPAEPAIEEAEAPTLPRPAPFTWSLGRLAARKQPIGRAALTALSALLLVTAILATTSSAWSSGHTARSLAAFSLTPSTTDGDASTDATSALSRGVTMPTAPATATPNLVGGGVPSGGGSWPAYTGPIASGQGCPSGQAPRPVSWAVGSAGGYGAPRLNTVALTFDDGPSPSSSPAILSFLERTHTPATFFVLGKYASAYPWLIQREAADGFTIGIHTWSHANMRLLTPAQRAWQFAATLQQLRADLGPSFCVWLWRPPYESFNTSIVRQAGSYGLTTILWNVDPADWSRPGTMTIVSRVLAQVRPGSIILLHDGPADRQQTAAALPYILAGLRARGLTPVSLPQLLLGYHPPKPSPTPTPKPTITPTATIAPSPTNTPSPIATPDPTATTAASDAGALFAAERLPGAGCRTLRGGWLTPDT